MLYDNYRYGDILPVGLGSHQIVASCDFETYSEAGFNIDPQTGKVRGVGANGKGGLQVIGTPNYACHDSTEVLCLYYDLKDGKGRRAWYPGFPDPLDLIAHIQNGGLIEAWNVTFEFWIWNMVCTKRYGWPTLPLDQCRCAMAKSRRHSLPGALAKAAVVLCTMEKDKEGGRLIQKLTRPHTPTKNRSEHRWTPATAWGDFMRFYAYCDVDVQTEDHASAMIPDLNPQELKTWQMDQTINLRGVPVDIEALDAMLDILGQTERKYTMELGQITQGAVGSVSEVAKFVDWLGSVGCRIPNMQKQTVADTLEREGIPPVARRALEIRDCLGAANVKKLRTLKLQVSADGRLRDQYMYCGADRTGRASAGGVQLQNITSKGPKSAQCESCEEFFCDGDNLLVPPDGGAPVCPHCGSFMFHAMPDWTVEAVESAIRCILKRDLHLLESTWGDPIVLLCGCLRGLFKAVEGKDFICCDFSAIEAVALACLTRCQWRIDVFNSHGKIYEMSASKITGTPESVYAEYREKNGMHHPDRKKIGKVAELACFSPRTKVLTRDGYVNIAEVKPHHELWDGVEWVTSGGTVNKGFKKILRLDGVGVTPGHPVSLGNSWKEAKVLASNRNILNQALAIGSANLPSFAMSVEKKNGARLFNVVAVAIRIFARSVIYISRKPHDAENAGERKRHLPMLRLMSNTRQFCPTVNIGGDFATGYPLQSDGAITQKIRCTLTTAGEGLSFVTNGDKIKARSFLTSSISKVTTNRLWKWIEKITILATFPVISVLSHVKKTCSTNALSSKCKNGSTNLSDVYDIVNAGRRHRFTIKTDSGHLLVHNSGYGGWINAWKNFGADMDDETIKQHILKWREESPEIVDFWGAQFRWCGPGKWDYRPELFGLEGAAINAILHPGQCFSVIDITYAVRDDILYCRLPSGRYLHYHRPRLAEAQDKLNRGPSYSITFEGYNSNSVKGPIGWHRLETYGGRLAENITQAVAADIQFDALLRCEARGYPIVMHTHDEGTAEVPEGFGSVDEMSAIMSERPAWASWWPLRAAGWRHKRYQKD